MMTARKTLRQRMDDIEVAARAMATPDVVAAADALLSDAQVMPEQVRDAALRVGLRVPTP